MSRKKPGPTLQAALRAARDLDRIFIQGRCGICREAVFVSYLSALNAEPVRCKIHKEEPK